MKWWEVFLELYTITITRQFGSMGQAIARQMAQMLGIEYYDREILEKVSEQTGLMMSTIKDEEERAQNRFGFMRFPLGRQTTDMQDKIFKVQEQIILELAEQQSCIIVGRCADYILRDFPNAVNIYIYAPEEDRLHNCIERFDMSEREAKSMIQDVDEARIAYHMRYAGYMPDDVKHKDILINSSFLGVEGTAQYLCECVKERFHINE
ncbi:AAA family ATPase [Frisingicoccus sp.]|uniref:cytidylate kinase-like family protein n=1 Tax=Frisingicoccus sp. TaxID=1918627 RepID=UPI00386FA042